MEHGALEVLDRHLPEARGVVDQLGDDPAGVGVALLLNLDQAQSARSVEEHEVRPPRL